MTVTTIFGIGIEDSDIVKIATVIVTASVAIFLFFLNQFFNRAKEKRELITEKTEELFLAAAGYSDKALNTIDYALDNFNALVKYEEKVTEEVLKFHAKNISELFIEISKVQMLLELYFRKYSKSSKYPLTTECNLKQILIDIDSKNLTLINSAQSVVVTTEQKIYQFCSYIAELNQAPFYKKVILKKKSN
ncbi:hypothetical protein EXT43_02735 [Pseudoalteromonas sp. CO109Y]|uniref:hypothetical protein n=1 Tax=Pseudoalteromonas sp. CO109Y TaxID=1777235 RepID=UPI0010233BAA|nr:hypothetical protein [Pseudoalteromonas sp. CO109Y]RZF87852.1 hypothetical protein EXT43_02735 [Pseudoalteromonas sp. CO109Y]